MADDLTVSVTLAHPLSPAQAVEVGLAEQEYRQGATVTLGVTGAKRLVYAGWTTISPTDHAAIAALFADVTPGWQGPALGVPVFVGPQPPENPPQRYVWYQTGLGDGSGMTTWVEDGM